MDKTVSDFDVIIVGAGPAGLSIGSELAQKGIHVLIIEQNQIGQTTKSWIVPGTIIEQLEEGVRACAYGGVTRIMEYTPNLQIQWDVTAPWPGSPEWKKYSYLHQERLLTYWADLIVANGSLIKSQTCCIDHYISNDRVFVTAVSTDRQAQKSEFSARLLVDASGSRSPIAISNNIDRKGYLWWSVYGWDIEFDDITLLKNPGSLGNMRVGDYMLWQYFNEYPRNANLTLGQMRPILEYEVLNKNKIFVFIFYYSDKMIETRFLKSQFHYLINNVEACAQFKTGRLVKERYGHYPSGGIDQQIARERIAFTGDAGCWTIPAGFGMGVILQNYKRYAAELASLIAADNLSAKALNTLTRWYTKEKYEILMDKLTLHFTLYALPASLDKFTKLIFNNFGGEMMETLFLLRLSEKQAIAIIKVVLANFSPRELLTIFKTKEDLLLIMEVAGEFCEATVKDLFEKAFGHKIQEGGFKFKNHFSLCQRAKHFFGHTFYNGFGRFLDSFFKTPKTEVELPGDDAFIDGVDVQWWYWTGHLRDRQGRRWGFELCFFAFDTWLIFKNILAQAAISDVSSNKFHFCEEVSYYHLPRKMANRFELRSSKNGALSAKGGGGSDHLSFTVDTFRLDLNLKAVSEAVSHYGGNIHSFSYGGDTLYYAREKMETQGTISIDGEQFAVEGTSWFDRQYGELFQSIFKGWQWFALELFSGEQIMLYDYTHHYQNERYGSITAGGETEEFPATAFNVKVLGSWISPHTGNRYPSGWLVEVKGRQFIVQPAIKDQELRAKHLFWVGPEYWEGKCVVYDLEKSEVGEAYVELNGYGKRILGFNIDGDAALAVRNK